MEIFIREKENEQMKGMISRRRLILSKCTKSCSIFASYFIFLTNLHTCSNRLGVFFHLKNADIFLISLQKHMLWVPTTYVFIEK